MRPCLKRERKIKTKKARDPLLTVLSHSDSFISQLLDAISLILIGACPAVACTRKVVRVGCCMRSRLCGSGEAELGEGASLGPHQLCLLSLWSSECLSLFPTPKEEFAISLTRI